MLFMLIDRRELCTIQQKLKEIEIAQREMQRTEMENNFTLPGDLMQAATAFDLPKSMAYPTIDRTCCVSIQDLSDRILCDLDTRNFSVIDNFVDEHLAAQILSEIRKLYGESSSFQPGQLSQLKQKPGVAAEPQKNVRGDLVTWVDSASYPEMKYLLAAVRLTDEIIAVMGNDQRLAACNIKSRSSIMVACYPGQGTRYKRHVDNPSSDGRKLTTILYLNEHYDSSRDGGLLRIYKPDGSAFYDIEPILRRLIIFWSDCRTPHEVLPSYRERFAVSVWYFDTKERSEALRRI